MIVFSFNFFNAKKIFMKVYIFSYIYCYEPLLDAAQSAFVFNDSKSFVDMKMKNQPGK